MVDNAGRLGDAGLPFVHEAAMCKIHASEVAERVSSMAVNLYGGAACNGRFPDRVGACLWANI